MAIRGEVCCGTSLCDIDYEYPRSRFRQKFGRLRGVHSESKNNLREGRQCGARRFFVVGDFNIGLGLLCTGDAEDDSDHSVGKNYDADPGGFNNLMWYAVMKEFGSKASSTWSSNDDRKEMAYRHQQWGWRVRLTQLEYIKGSKSHICDTHICNNFAVLVDRFPVNGVVQDEGEREMVHCGEDEEKSGQDGGRAMTSTMRCSRGL